MNREYKLPKLTLVGAGPGDPDLITIKGAQALYEADIVLYDALVDRDLLQYVRDGVPKIFVGKRKGYHKYSQEHINGMIVSYAFQYGNVVRLKGGDPFVFARGAEEIEYAASFGIPAESIPGISSVVAVAESQGIPLTKRHVSESFWVLTGTTSGRKLSEDIHKAVQSTATVVIVMGMSKLSEIVAAFQQKGRGELPVAVIQNGTTKNEKTGLGTVDSILEVVKNKKLSAPAIIVIGEVVRHSVQLRTFYEKITLSDPDRFLSHNRSNKTANYLNQKQ